MVALARSFPPTALPQLDRWAWLSNEPDPAACGEDLHLLTPYEMRLLGKKAVTLYRVLERERGWCSRWIVRSFDWLTKKTGFESKAHTKRALARLRACGAVESQWSHEQVGVGWVTHMTHRVWGTFDLRGDVLRVLLPAPKFERWADQNRPQGRPSKISLKSKRCTPTPLREGCFSNQESSTYLVKMYSKNKHNTNILLSESLLPSEEKPTPQRGGVLLSLKSESPKPLDSKSAIALIDQALDRPRTALKPTLDSNVVIPPLDPIPYEENCPMSIPAWTPVRARVELLARCYREAVETVYKRKCHVLQFTDIQKSKLYSRLADCAEALVEHEIAPEAWATWNLERARKRGQATPTPIAIVFAAGAVTKRRGWFRKDYDGPSGKKYKIERVHYEQLFRRQEAFARKRGLGPSLAFGYAPPWYVEMRKKEIALGYVDPTHFYPRLTKRETGKR